MLKSIAQIILFMSIGMLIVIPVTWVLDSSTFTFSLLFTSVQNLVKIFALLVVNALKFSFVDLFVKILLSFLIIKGILYILFNLAPIMIIGSLKNKAKKAKIKVNEKIDKNINKSRKLDNRSLELRRTSLKKSYKR